MVQPTLIILAAGRARRYGGLKQLAPIGVHGEAVIDLLASDAFAAGFARIVVVVNPETGPQIEAHVRRHWPLNRVIDFAVQDEPRGTVPAVLAAERYVDPSTPFGVSNADDLYGPQVLAQLAAHLASKETCCLIGFRLDRALVGDLPVSRGVCHVVNGHLTDIWERRRVHATVDGFVADDGESPVFLEPDTTVSMNLWGFQPAMWALLEQEMATHDFVTQPESLLSEMVGKVLHHVPLRFDVLNTEARCVGVTHADDLALVQADVRLQVSLGERPEHAFR